jgi:hypothetical protein
MRPSPRAASDGPGETTLHERPSDPAVTRRARATAIATLVTVSIAALSGCAASTTPEPAPAPTPSLTQEQQDAATFEDLFTRYENLDPNLMTRDSLDLLLTGDALDGEEKGLTEVADEHKTYEGTATVSNFTVTEQGKDKAANDYMIGQACLDISQTRVLGPDGNQLNPDRPPTLSMQMRAVKISDGSWRISNVVRNDNVGACS